LEALEPLQLHLARAGNYLVVSWPGGLTGSFLETSSTINGPIWARLFALNGPGGAWSNLISLPNLFIRMTPP
jgi:hypothetical protein